MLQAKNEMGNVEDLYALTPMQQGLLFYSLYSPESDIYFEQMSCALSGQVDISTFEQAWQKVIERHVVLRTSFMWEGIDEPIQIVRPKVTLPLVKLDWGGQTPDEQR